MIVTLVKYASNHKRHISEAIQISLTLTGLVSKPFMGNSILKLSALQMNLTGKETFF